jgi:YggT family protein
MWAAIGVLSLLLKIYFWGLLITVIASWVAPNSYNPVLILINQILEPAIKPIRKMMPDMGGIDLSPIIAFLLIQVLEILVVKVLVQASGMPSGLVLGI